ncbi:MAG: hypothetical protein Q8R04_07090, partial [Nanoarchaeota archaeon]|nr:hypothetical protein [Nanoarchaeota archaeon]
MFIAAFPFKYYKFLPDFALATKIRQKSWNIDKLFPRLKERKAELRGLIKDIKSNLGNILKVRNPIELLSREIREGIKNLKYINFYDSTLLYLYYRLLHHVFDLCKKEEARLKAEMQNALSKEINPKDKAENVKKAKEDIEKDIKEHKKLIRSFDAAKRSLVDAYESLVRELRKRR